MISEEDITIGLVGVVAALDEPATPYPPYLYLSCTGPDCDFFDKDDLLSGLTLSRVLSKKPGGIIISFGSCSVFFPLLIRFIHSNKYLTCSCSTTESFKNGINRTQAKFHVTDWSKNITLTNFNVIGNLFSRNFLIRLTFRS